MSDCQFQHDAAAYMLGALDPGDKHEFEAHLPECASCSAEVRGFTELPGVLAHAPIEDLSTEPPPENMMATLVDKVRRERRSRLFRSVVVAAAAAVLFAVGAVAVVEMAGPEIESTAMEVELAPINAVPITSEAGMVAQDEGTRIDLSCDEKDKSGGDDGGTSAYRLIVTNTEGKTDVAGSWTGAKDGSTRVVLFTRWRPENIAALEIQNMDEEAVLAWKKP